MELRPEEISRIIRSQIKHYETKINQSETGTVTLIGDGIARAAGLDGCMAGELLEFPGGVYGMAQNLEESSVSIVMLGSEEGIREGDTVKRTGRVVSVPVGEALIGRVVDALGQPIDGKGPIDAVRFDPIEAPAPGILERKSVSVPLQTGIKAIDSMIPIGRGQRELIIGDRQTGKTTIATDTILNQKGKDVICIYVAIGQKRSTVAQPRRMPRPGGAMSYTIVVSATASELSPLQYIAPYSGCHGRILHAQGQGRAHHLRRPVQARCRLPRPVAADPPSSGTRGLPRRRVLSALPSARARGQALRRAGRRQPDGTAHHRDAGRRRVRLHPTNVISITDGQIFLETELFHSGIMPAVNPGISVSRVGGNAQIKAMKKVAGTLKLIYSQYRELQSFAQFGSDLDADTKARLAQGERIVEVLKQDRNAPVDVAHQVAILYAVIGGYLKDVPVAKIRAFETELYPWMDANYAELLENIRTTGKLSDEDEAALKTAIETRVAEFLRNL